MKVFDAGETRMIGLPYCEKKTMTIMLNSFGTIPACHGTDGRTELLYINMARQHTDAR